YFDGQMGLLTGPLTAVLVGSPRAPLSAGDASSVAGHLAALPAEERENLLVSVYVAPGTPVAEIDAVLRRPGTDKMSIFTSSDSTAVLPSFAPSRELGEGRTSVDALLDPSTGRVGAPPRRRAVAPPPSESGVGTSGAGSVLT